MTINTGELITVIAESAYLVIEDQSLSQDIKLLFLDHIGRILSINDPFENNNTINHAEEFIWF